MSDALHASRLPAATAWRFGYLLLQGLSSLALFLALAQVLDPAPFAAIAVAQGVLVLAQAIGDFGISQAAASALTSRASAEPERLEELEAAAASATWMGAAGALVLVFACALLLDGPAADATAWIAPAAACAVLVAGIDGLLRGRGEFRRPVVVVGLSRLGAFAAIPVAAASGDAASTAIALSAGSLLGTLPAARLLAARTARAAGADLAWFFRAVLPLGLSQVLVVGSARLNTVILGSAAGVREAAAFESAWRVYQLGQYAGGSVATAAAPFIADAAGSGRAEQARRLTRRLMLGAGGAGIVIGAGLWLVGAAVADHLFPGLGDRVADLLPALAAATPVALAGQVALAALSSDDRQRRYVPLAFAGGAAVNLVWVTVVTTAEGAARGSAAAAVVIGVVLVAMALRR